MPFGLPQTRSSCCPLWLTKGWETSTLRWLPRKTPTDAELYAVWEMESGRGWLLLPPGFGEEVYAFGYDPGPDVFEERNKVHPWFYPHFRFRPVPLASPETMEMLKKLF